MLNQKLQPLTVVLSVLVDIILKGYYKEKVIPRIAIELDQLCLRKSLGQQLPFHILLYLLNGLHQEDVLLCKIGVTTVWCTWSGTKSLLVRSLPSCYRSILVERSEALGRCKLGLLDL